MSKEIVSLNGEDLKPGMVVAEDFKMGNSRVKRGTILSKLLIENIKEYHNIDIKVFKNQDLYNMKTAARVENKISTREHFKIAIDMYNKNLDFLSSRKNLTLQSLNVVSSYIHENITNVKDIIDIIIMDRVNTSSYQIKHMINVAVLSGLLAKWMKLEEKDVRLLIKAGLLHDLGMLKIDPEIIEKPGRLSQDEFEKIKKHVSLSYEAIKDFTLIPKSVKYGVLMHHERKNGTGYPLGLKGDQIHIYGKILAVADIFDAMTSNKAYKDRASLFEVLNHFSKETFELLDTQCTMTFIKKIANYYVGSKVLLSNNEIGTIIRIDQNNVTNPLIQVDDRFLDLLSNPSIKILDIYQDS